MEKLIPIGYLMLPFCVLALGQVREGHIVAFVLLAFLSLSATVKNKPLRCLCYYFLGWQLYIRLNVIFLNDLNVIMSSQLASQVFGHVTYALILYAAIVRCDFKHWITVIRVAVLLQMIFAWCQVFGWFLYLDFLKYIGLPMVLTKVSPMIFGTLQNPNFLAMMLVISAPFFFKGKMLSWRISIPMWTALVPLVGLLAMLTTSTAVVALVAGVGVYFFDMKHLKKLKERQYILALVAFMMVVLYWLTFIDNTNIFASKRWIFWWKVLEVILTDPRAFLVGIGPGSYISYEWPSLHNDWLQAWYEMGVISVSFMVWAVASYWKSNRELFTALVIACVCMLGGYPLRLAPLAFLIIIILALLEKEKYGTFTGKTNSKKDVQVKNNQHKCSCISRNRNRKST